MAEELQALKETFWWISELPDKQKIPNTLFLQGDFNLILYHQAYFQTFSTVFLNGM